MRRANERAARGSACRSRVRLERERERRLGEVEARAGSSGLAFASRSRSRGCSASRRRPVDRRRAGVRPPACASAHAFASTAPDVLDEPLVDDREPARPRRRLAHFASAPISASRSAASIGTRSASATRSAASGVVDLRERLARAFRARSASRPKIASRSRSRGAASACFSAASSSARRSARVARPVGGLDRLAVLAARGWRRARRSGGRRARPAAGAASGASRCPSWMSSKTEAVSLR